MKTQKLPLATFNQKAKTLVRSVDKNTVAEYSLVVKKALAEKTEIPFPPIIVVLDDEGEYWPAGGSHRVAALLENGVTEYDFEVRRGTPLDAVNLGIEDNKRHGKRPDGNDVKHSLEVLFKLDEESSKLTNTALADKLGVTEGTIRKYRPATKSPSVRVTKKGKTVTVGKIGKKAGKTEKPAAKEKPAKAAKNGKGATAESKSTEKQDTRLQDNANKIADGLRTVGYDGDKVRKAIMAGVVKASVKELEMLASFKPQRMAQVWRLISGDRVSILKAIQIIDSVTSENTKLGELVNLSISKGGFHYDKIKEVNAGFLVFQLDQFKVEPNEKGDVITLTRK